MTTFDARPREPDLVASIRETSQELVRLSGVRGGDDVLPMALRAFRAAGHTLGKGDHPRAVERDLIAATGELGEVTAWLAYDADRQDVSRQVIHEALVLSRRAGDRDMERFELTHLAMQSVHLHRPAEALRITRGFPDGCLPPRVEAVLAIREGRALAQLGQAGDALAELARARSILLDGVAARDPYWTWWVDDAEVLWHTGMAHAQLGDWAGAIPKLREAVRLRGASQRRARFNDTVYLLNALVHVGDWREAEPVLRDAVRRMDEVSSAIITNVLRRVADRIAGSDAPSTVADLADEVRRAARAG